MISRMIPRNVPNPFPCRARLKATRFIRVFLPTLALATLMNISAADSPDNFETIKTRILDQEKALQNLSIETEVSDGYLDPVSNQWVESTEPGHYQLDCDGFAMSRFRVDYSPGINRFVSGTLHYSKKIGWIASDGAMVSVFDETIESMTGAMFKVNRGYVWGMNSKIAESYRRDTLFKSGLFFTPLLVPVSGGKSLFEQGLPYDLAVTVSRDKQTPGILLLDIRALSRNYIARMWLDEKHGYQLVRSENIKLTGFKGAETDTKEIFSTEGSIADPTNKVFMGKSLTYERYQKGELQERMKVTVKGLTINTGQLATALATSFPPGTMVHDDRVNLNYTAGSSPTDTLKQIETQASQIKGN